jgi:hypothetical protein
MLVRAQPVLLVFSGHGAVNVKLRILENFTLYLRNRQSGNLRAIESCVCSIRSIERNMMSFLRTVRRPAWLTDHTTCPGLGLIYSSSSIVY